MHAVSRLLAEVSKFCGNIGDPSQLKSLFSFAYNAFRYRVYIRVQVAMLSFARK